MNHFDENIWSLNFLSHKETFFEKGGNFLKLFSVINQRMNFDNTCGNSKNMTFKCLVLNLKKISPIYIFQSIYSSHVRKIYVQVVIGLEHLKSFDLRNMKSKVILIFGILAVSQGAVPRDRFAICTFFPEQCLSTKPFEGTTLHSNFKESD